jgi:serine/threonine protein kinase/Tol biopolymer transport system component
MGEVYKATDTNLKRAVAIKVLPAALAADADRIARFQREAEVLGALNHPHIAALYGLERSGDTTALVMELVEGEDLSQRIARGAIPIDEVLPIAKQIADALEAAHEQGIIHRDLKPANIKMRPDGTVKVLDFGLAKAMEPTAGSSPSVSMSPTITTPAMTQAGMVLGTAAYMSPEQAKSRAIDMRTDVWAFGCVVYEMLAGRSAFGGEDVADTLAFVLTREPDWSRMPANTPAAVRRLLRRCLQKDRRRRLQTIGDARIEIDDAGTEPDAVPTSAGVADTARLPWIVAAVGIILALALAAPALRHLREASPSESPELRTEIVTPATSDLLSFALSPDGRQLVFVASEGGPARLWLRSLSATGAQPLTGTEGALHPFWSPDGRSIGFFANGKLKRIDVGKGQPQALTDATSGRGGTWNADGIIVFAASVIGPLSRISAGGGIATAVTTLGRHTGHRYPSFLPDGRHFLFYAEGASDVTGIYIGSLDSSDTRRLMAANSRGVYVAPGWLMWPSSGRLLAQRLDVMRNALVGDQETVADSVNSSGGTGGVALSASATGLVAYRTGGAGVQRQLTWVDRSGKALGTLGAVDDGNPIAPRLSPDGKRVAVFRNVGNTDVWLLDRASTTRFTFDPALDRFPIWSPDGSRIVFDSNRSGLRHLFVKPSSGAGGEQVLLESDQAKVAMDWSPDGRFLLYVSIDPQTGQDLWVLPMEGDRKTRVFLKTKFVETSGQFSPDGRWVAYHSNESGRYEIWVRPFVERTEAAAGSDRAGAQWMISTEGGLFPRWRPDGRELYYLDGTGQMMGVPVTSTPTTFEAGAPTALFRPPIVGGGVDTGPGKQYDVARDGRFLINMIIESVSPITLLQNWHPENKK